MLLERGDFCAGASGGNHGLLHSGGRYAVKDPESARECAAESKVLRKIAWNCIEDTGGLFVGLEKDGPGFADEFAKGCKATGVRCDRLSKRELLDLERSLTPDVREGFAVDDGAVDPFRLALTNIEDARRNGATVRNHCEVTAIVRKDGHIDSVRFKDHRDGSAGDVAPDIVVNASGSSSGRILDMAGLKLAMTKDFGALVVFNGKLVQRTVNRLRLPSDGDIIVPSHTSMIAGTTARTVKDGPIAKPSREEAALIVREVSEMVPGLKGCREIRAYGASRPLVSGSGREASRTFKLIDHEAEGVDNLISIIGGKLTTYRLMAEKASDAVCGKLGIGGKCVTDKEVMVERDDGAMIAGLSAAQSESLRRRYGNVPSFMLEGERTGMPLVQSCSCENVMRFELEHYAASDDVLTIADLMRRTRAGMGFCQGTSCVWEMASALASEGNAEQFVRDFVKERREGSNAILEGEQLSQEVFRSHLLWTYETNGTKGERP